MGFFLPDLSLQVDEFACVHGLYVCVSVQEKNSLPLIANFFGGYSYCFSLRMVSVSHTNTFSFHRVFFFFPPWWKEKKHTVERKSISMGDTNHPQRKTIRIAPKEVSYQGEGILFLHGNAHIKPMHAGKLVNLQ